jgi:hypothetical protein
MDGSIPLHLQMEKSLEPPAQYYLRIAVVSQHHRGPRAWHQPRIKMHDDACGRSDEQQKACGRLNEEARQRFLDGAPSRRNTLPGRR